MKKESSSDTLHWVFVVKDRYFLSPNIGSWQSHSIYLGINKLTTTELAKATLFPVPMDGPPYDSQALRSGKWVRVRKVVSLVWDQEAVQ